MADGCLTLETSSSITYPRGLPHSRPLALPIGRKQSHVALQDPSPDSAPPLTQRDAQQLLGWEPV
eukprot:CAMPEP_0117682458 /NCGR_PEP_ID=MMETSP0804-20121206/19672_1 /TAXON_ID=1074897 /ORGANISM="Tetraselmis astigmatica, Strain CCMP880" /LENGTH=64 /DNA_ID=CAMNT_0005492575 /DNA_START=91 /DNA_END=285 /DNA_ORIENTATION=+